MLVFCQSIRIAGPVGKAERLLLEDPTPSCASGRLVLIRPAAGLALIPLAAGACSLIRPGARTPIEAGALDGERGAVEGASLQERSPAAEATPRTPMSGGGARINAYPNGRFAS